MEIFKKKRKERKKERYRETYRVREKISLDYSLFFSLKVTKGYVRVGITFPVIRKYIYMHTHGWCSISSLKIGC